MSAFFTPDNPAQKQPRSIVFLHFLSITYALISKVLSCQTKPTNRVTKLDRPASQIPALGNLSEITLNAPRPDHCPLGSEQTKAFPTAMGFTAPTSSRPPNQKLTLGTAFLIQSIYPAPGNMMKFSPTVVPSARMPTEPICPPKISKRCMLDAFAGPRPPRIP